MHGDPEEPVLAPVGAPRVAPDPVLLPTLLPPPHHRDLVVDDGVADLLRVDPSGVLFKRVSDVDSTTYSRRELLIHFP